MVLVQDHGLSLWCGFQLNRYGSGEGELLDALSKNRTRHLANVRTKTKYRAIAVPSPGGAGQVEGERGRRREAADFEGGVVWSAV